MQTGALEELKVNDALDGVGYSNEDIDRLLDQLQLESGSGTGIHPDEIPELSARLELQGRWRKNEAL